MEKVKIDNRLFYKQVLTLGIPVMLQSLIQSLVNLLDVFMIGQLGEAEITAVSMGSGWVNLLFYLFGGISATGSVFIAQYWGKKDLQNIHSYMGLMAVINVVSGILFALFTACFSSEIIRFYTNDPQVIAYGSSYLKIMSVYCVLYALVNVSAVALRSTEQTVLPMAGTILSLCVNLVLNYILIFGRFGLPAMGVQGAAYATVIALTVQVVFLYGSAWLKKSPICAPVREYFKISGQQVKKYFVHGAFLILCEVIFGVGSNVSNIAYKYTGTNGQAALQIMNTFHQLSLVFSIGLGTAASIMIGKLLGENQLELVKLYSKRFMLLIPAAAAGLGVIVYFCSPALLSMFNINEQTLEYAKKLMIILAVTLPLKAESYALLVGILRSGGDSAYCFLTNFVGTWIISVPMIFLGAVVLKLPIHWVYLMSCACELGKIAVALPRTLSYKWVRNIT